MPRIAHISFGFALVLLLAGCPRNAEQQAADSLYWNPPDMMGPEWMPWTFEWLFLQVSADPVVYISSESSIYPQQSLTDDEMGDGVIVRPSKIEDILPRIAAFQGEQDASGRKAVVIINGDDRAVCGSILKASESCRN